MRILRRSLRDNENLFEATFEDQFLDVYRISKDLCLVLIEELYGKTGTKSKNVQIICDADFIILNVTAGTAHDSYIWKRSALKTLLENMYTQDDRNFWLIGDSGYPLQPWLMTLILSPNSRAQEKYNKAHKVTRSIVERCIGILKSRFRCLSKECTLYYSSEKAGLIINACAVPHKGASRFSERMQTNVRSAVLTMWTALQILANESERMAANEVCLQSVYGIANANEAVWYHLLPFAASCKS